MEPTNWMNQQMESITNLDTWFEFFNMTGSAYWMFKGKYLNVYNHERKVIPLKYSNLTIFKNKIMFLIFLYGTVFGNE